MEEKVRHLDVQLHHRDSEIKRLQSKIDLGSINMDKLAND